MVFLEWSENYRYPVDDQYLEKKLVPQSSPGFVRQGADYIDAEMKIQHSNPEWNLVRLILWRWEFDIGGEKWIILKHANGLFDDWQTHYYYMNNIQGSGFGANVGDCHWLTLQEVDQAHRGIWVDTGKSHLCPFDPNEGYYMLPEGLVLLEKDKKWRRKLCYVIANSYRTELPARLYRPLTFGQQGRPGTFSITNAHKESSDPERTAEPSQSSGRDGNYSYAHDDTSWWANRSTRGQQVRTEQRAQFALSTSDEAAQHMAGLPEPPSWSNPTQTEQQLSWDQWNHHHQHHQHQQEQTRPMDQSATMNVAAAIPRLDLHQCQEQHVRPPELGIPPERARSDMNDQPDSPGDMPTVLPPSSSMPLPVTPTYAQVTDVEDDSDETMSEAPTVR